LKKHNFSSGPAILPNSVMEAAAAAVIDFDGMGLSILEISHRSKAFVAVMDEAEALVRELLHLTNDYGVLFLSGGASSQFFMSAMNLLGNDETAAYLDTGTWSEKAIKEAKNFGKIAVVASSKAADYTYIPKEFELPNDAKYLHLTTNNTVYGTQFHALPEVEIPIVADMSSDIFSRTIELSRYGLIYAGAQKNTGPAGVTLVIVRKDLLGKVQRVIPTMLDYRVHLDKGSMFNTPPVFPIYVAMLTLRWLKAQGGVAAIEQRNIEKAALLYAEIDRNPLFEGRVATEDRSLMNVNFMAKTPEIEQGFLKYCEENLISGIKGYRTVGGFRASIYNAMPLESVQYLIELMQRFEQEIG
jgi:phosphoserine aminotransferase